MKFQLIFSSRIGISRRNKTLSDCLSNKEKYFTIYYGSCPVLYRCSLDFWLRKKNVGITRIVSNVSVRYISIIYYKHLNNYYYNIYNIKKQPCIILYTHVCWYLRSNIYFNTIRWVNVIQKGYPPCLTSHITRYVFICEPLQHNIRKVSGLILFFKLFNKCINFSQVLSIFKF